MKQVSIHVVSAIVRLVPTMIVGGLYVLQIRQLASFWIVGAAGLSVAVLSAASARRLDSLRSALMAAISGVAALYIVVATALRLLQLTGLGFALDAAGEIWNQQFVLALPLMLFVAITGVLYLRRPGFGGTDTLLHAGLWLMVLWNQGQYQLTLLSHPLQLAVAAVVFIAAQIAALTASRAAGHAGYRRPRRTTASLGAFAVLVVLLLTTAGGLAMHLYSAAAAAASGGLMRPTLFRFDLSDFLTLESEISMSDNLVLLYRREGRSQWDLLRRFVLNSYEPRRGFFRSDSPGARYPDSVPRRTQRYTVEDDMSRVTAAQEYHLINLDPGSLIARSEPEMVVPLRQPSDSPFVSSYQVESRVSYAVAEELQRISRQDMQQGLGGELYDFYTRSQATERIIALSDTLTTDSSTPYHAAAAILKFLQNEFTYSLSPGVAVDGDQLSHFLFESRKGYCSYFAFAMALMLREQGIPARVAVGFFADPQQQVLNVYPIRANMAHAWIEAYFGEYGWIEFDPTSFTPTPGEEPPPNQPIDPDELEELLSAVFSHPAEPLESAEQDAPPAGSADRPGFTIEHAGRLLQMVVVFILLLLVLWRSRNRVLARLLFHRGWRRSVRLQYYSVVGGYLMPDKRRSNETVEEFAARMQLAAGPALQQLTELYNYARFAPHEDSGETGSKNIAVRARAAAAMVRSRLRRGWGWRYPLTWLLPGRWIYRIWPHGFSAAAFLIAVLLFTAGSPSLLRADVLPTDEQHPVEWYQDQARTAEQREYFDRARRLLQQGIEQHPQSDLLRSQLGELYFSAEMYRLALQQYKQASQLNPESLRHRYDLGETYTRLNRNYQAIAVLEDVLDQQPDDDLLITDLGWLYYRTYQYQQGIRLLENAQERLGSRSSLQLILAAHYTGLYEYENARSAYVSAIDSAVERGDRTFAAVAFYNLSLLERVFYRYENSAEAVRGSIEQRPRATGYLSAGELEHNRLQFAAAEAALLRAVELDGQTPLPYISLARLYIRFGMVQSARAYLNAAERVQEFWMYKYGTNPEHHVMRMFELRRDVFAASAETERRRAYAGLRDWADRLFASFRYRVRSWFAGLEFRRAALRVAGAHLEEGNRIDGHRTAARAFERIPFLERRHLRRAAAIEVPLLPESQRWYALSEAELSRRSEPVLAAVLHLDQEYERYRVLEGLLQAADYASGERRREIVLRAAALAPGRVRAAGFRLPVCISEDDPGIETGLSRRYLRSIGLEPAAASDACAAQLRISTARSADAWQVVIELYTPQGDSRLDTAQVTLEAGLVPNIRRQEIARAILNVLESPRM